PTTLNTYVVVALGVTVAVPFTATEPPGVSVALVAAVELNVRMAELPTAIEVGFAVIVAVGGTLVTAMVVDAVASPPIPIAVSVYVVVIDGETTTVPLGAWKEPRGSIVTPLAPVVVYVSVDELPFAIDGLEDVRAAVGGVGFPTLKSLNRVTD